MTASYKPKGIDEIKDRYENLLVAKDLTPQKRGFELEILLRWVFELEGLEPKASYRKSGEQMDGSFFWMGQTFIFEAKWEKSKISASTIYSFKGKVDGKFHTTSGIFIAMNGFGNDTEEALISGKNANILLFDGEDMAFIFSGEITFLEVLKYKIRKAGDTGSLYSKYSMDKEAKIIARGRPNMAEFIHSIKYPKGESLLFNDVLVFVESKDDYSLAEKIIKSIESASQLSFKIIVLEGAYNITDIPSFIDTFQGAGQLKGVIVFLDEDMDNKRFQKLIENVAGQLDNAAISISNLFLFLDDNIKLGFQANAKQIDTHYLEGIKYKISSFLETTTEEYYDPEEFSLEDTLEAITKDLEWDYSENCIYYDDDYSHIPGTLRSLDELVDYLNEFIVDGKLSNLPLEWIKEMDAIDYSWEIREYLETNFEQQLDDIGWS